MDIEDSNGRSYMSGGKALEWVQAFDTCYMLDRVTRIKWTDLVERDFIGTKVMAFLRSQPVLLPPAQLSLFRKPLLRNTCSQDPALVLENTQMEKFLP
ncbi:hypothetical protein DBR06_SOUSAS2310013 [Sousa chinensis]|nr:hypothetical protein DBR06_SOUSAS2310013 [Sousa chinensis]